MPVSVPSANGEAHASRYSGVSSGRSSLVAAADDAALVAEIRYGQRQLLLLSNGGAKRAALHLRASVRGRPRKAAQSA